MVENSTPGVLAGNFISEKLRVTVCTELSRNMMKWTMP
jgi:hypothetical protein